MKMRGKSIEVLYLSYDGLTDTLGQSQILPYLKGLASEGYSITVVTFEKPDRFAEYGMLTDTICKQASIEWKPIKYHKSPVILSTLYDLLILRWTIKKILVSKPISIIHCRSYVVALLGLWAKRKYGLKLVFDMRGFWIEERFDGGIWQHRNPLHKLMYHFFKSKEKQLVKEADHLVALTVNAATEIRSWNLSRVPITVIPTCVDMALFDPGIIAHRQDDLRNSLSIAPEDFVLVYSGSWGSWYMTAQILEFYSVLSIHSPTSRLLVLTPDNPDLTGYAQASKVIVRKVSRHEMPLFLGLADAAVCFIKPTFSKKASSATKIAEAWAMNLPVVTNGGWGDINKLHDEGMPLFLCNSRSEYDEIAKSILGLRPRRPQNIRSLLLGTLDLATGIQKYKSIYESLGRI